MKTKTLRQLVSRSISIWDLRLDNAAAGLPSIMSAVGALRKCKQRERRNRRRARRYARR